MATKKIGLCSKRLEEKKKMRPWRLQKNTKILFLACSLFKSESPNWKRQRVTRIYHRCLVIFCVGKHYYGCQKERQTNKREKTQQHLNITVHSTAVNRWLLNEMKLNIHYPDLYGFVLISTFLLCNEGN